MTISPQATRDIPAETQQFRQYLNSECGLAGQTVSYYCRETAAFLEWLGSLRIDHLQIESFAKSRPVSPATRRKKLMAVRQYARFLVAHGRLDAGVISKIDPIRVDARANVTVPTPDEVANMIDAVAGNRVVRDRAIIEVLFSCGLRRGELCALNTDSIRPDGTVPVSGKGRRDRIVPIGQAALGALREYLEWRRPHAPAAEKALFVRSSGRRISPEDISRIVGGAARKAGLVGVSAHSLRHACACALLEGGCPLDDIRRFLGHDNLSTTQMYLKLCPAYLKKVHRENHPRQ